MHRTATGLIAGPESPPVTPASAGLIDFVSMTNPNNVFITETPVAPACATEEAISTMSVTSGESLANIGILLSLFRRTI
jgi:hypothetical protein